ncbi:MAG TPA: hypothetical protein VJ962_02360 [Clostridia bacterium]|nr:hypothetical protein [Clostridia bacterium]
MNRKSFVDLTALLDVVLILFFAVLINMANSVEVISEENNEMIDQVEEVQAKNKDMKDELEKALKDLELKESELASLYGSEADVLEDYREIIDRISKIDIMLVGENNELYINEEETDINIVRERLETPSRRDILEEEIKSAINLAIETRDKSSFIFIRISVNDRDVYKYAYDYLTEIVNTVVSDYGRDKVMMSREFE